MKKPIKTVIEKKQTAKRWRENNKEYLKKWKREWYEKNCMNNPKYKARRKKYQKENLARHRERDRKKYYEDPNFRMRKILNQNKDEQ